MIIRTLRAKVILVALILFATITLMIGVGMRARTVHEQLEIVNKFEFIGVAIKAYHSEHGRFPATLDELVTDSNLDYALIRAIHGERIEYWAPNEEELDNTPVLAVTGHGMKLTLQKNFERQRFELPD